MAKLNASRTAQYPLVSEFVFNFNDYVIDSVDLVKKTFGSSTALADPSGSVTGLTAPTGLVFDAINLPQGATIVGGEVIVETAFVGIGAGATLSLGNAGNTTALVNAMDLDTATADSRTALTLTAPLVANAGTNLRLTTAGLTAAGATAGKVRVRVMFTVDGRAMETYPI
jgi:hypothetical protein